jgi:hypothetical protein
MVEPFSLTALGVYAAKEGIEFLYEQAGQVLQRWRDRKAGRAAESEAPVSLAHTDALEGVLQQPAINFEAVERLHEDIKTLASVLGGYAGGLEDSEPGDEELASAVDGLRQALEVVYGQRITFKGERREPSGPAVFGRAEVERVEGDVAGVRARLIRSGRVTGEAHAKDVPAGGKLSGVDVDTVG